MLLTWLLFPLSLSLMLFLGPQRSMASAAEHKLHLVVAIYWEGDILKEQNFKALRDIKKNFPKLTFIHFLSPTYFLNSEKESMKNHADLLGVLEPKKDQIGLYLGSWQQVTDKADIFFRSSPSFWGANSTPCEEDCGLSVPLNVYDYQEINGIFKVSHEALQSSGLPINPEIYSIAGWVHSADIDAVARHYHYAINFSAIPPSRIKGDLKDFPVYKWVQSHWTPFEKIHEPRVLETKTSQNTILIPQNLGVIDYASHQEILTYFAQAIQSQSPKSIAVLSINGRTLATLSGRVQKSLSSIFQLAQEKNVTLTFDWKSYRDMLQLKD